MIKKEFKYELQNQFRYDDTSSGQTGTNAKFLLIKAPRNINREHTCKLKQLFVQSQMGLISKMNIDDTKATKKSEPTEFDTHMINMVIWGGSVPVSEFLDVLCTLLTNDLCLIDGKVKLTKYLFELLSDEEVFDILVEYFINFFGLFLKKMNSPK